MPQQLRIGILSCFEPEWEALRRRIKAPDETRINGQVFAMGTLAEKPVVAVMSGMSMVNAAMSAQILIDRFNISVLIVSGIGGALDPKLNIGDVVIPSRWAQSLEIIMGRKTETGVERPMWLTWASDLKPYADMIPNRVVVGNQDKAPSPHLWFECDQALFERAQGLVHLPLPYKTATGLELPHPPRVHIGGQGISSSAFIDNAQYRAYGHEVFKACIADMESAAVGHVAYANRVPYIVFRSVSDLAGGSGQENEMAIFMQLASENAATLVEAFLRII